MPKFCRSAKCHSCEKCSKLANEFKVITKMCDKDYLTLALFQKNHNHKTNKKDLELPRNYESF